MTRNLRTSSHRGTRNSTQLRGEGIFEARLPNDTQRVLRRHQRTADGHKDPVFGAPPRLGALGGNHDSLPSRTALRAFLRSACLRFAMLALWESWHEEESIHCVGRRNLLLGWSSGGGVYPLPSHYPVR